MDVLASNNSISGLVEQPVDSQSSFLDIFSARENTPRAQNFTSEAVESAPRGQPSTSEAVQDIYGGQPSTSEAADASLSNAQASAATQPTTPKNKRTR